MKKSLCSPGRKQLSILEPHNHEEVDTCLLIHVKNASLCGLQLKPKRGKKIALTVSNIALYAHILEKAVDKWKAFHCDCYDDKEDYVRLLENGKKALFLPGSYREFFTLKKCKEELGKDYNKITLLLCTRDDFSRHEEDSESSRSSSSKRPRVQTYFSDDGCRHEEDSESSRSSSSKRPRVQTYFSDDGCFENYESDKQHSPVQTETWLGDNMTEAYDRKEVQVQIHQDEALARKIQERRT